MAKRGMKFEEGLSIFKSILTKHCLHRPPYSIFVFSENDKTLILNFALNSFFRHLSLYEYSFKPKIDLELVTIGKKFKEVVVDKTSNKETSHLLGEEDHAS